MKIWKDWDEKLKRWIHKADFTYKGKRYRLEEFKKEDLEQVIVQIKSNVIRKSVGLESRAPKITIGDLLAEHIKDFDLSMKTHRRGKVIVEMFVKHLGSDIPVESLTTSDIRKYVRWRKSKSDLMPESVNKEVGYISSMLKKASGHFKELDSYKPPKMPWESVPKNESQRVIYQGEREALLNHLRHPQAHAGEKPTSRTARLEYADMFEIAYHTAMRWGEVHLVEWRMIDWAKGEINLPAEVTKTGTSRIAYINSRALEILTKRQKVSNSKYVFPGHSPDVPRKYYYEGIKRAAKKLKLPFGRDVGFTLHSSRHTAITDILHETGDFAAAQKIAGHSDGTMTTKYAHATRTRVQDAIQKLVEKSGFSDTPRQNPDSENQESS